MIRLLFADEPNTQQNHDNADGSQPGPGGNKKKKQQDAAADEHITDDLLNRAFSAWVAFHSYAVVRLTRRKNHLPVYPMRWR